MTQFEVYKAIASITGALAKDGIAKNRKNDQQHYDYRGVDDIYNSLASLIAEHKLCIIPRVQNRTVSERHSIKRDRDGNERTSVLFYVTVDVEYDLVSAEDGSKHTARSFGEAMDSGDKATNKAMSAAYKYLCLQTFCIPTKGDNDADATTHDGIQPAAPHPTSSSVASDEVSEFKAKVAEAHAKQGLSAFHRKFINDMHARIQQYGNKVNLPSEKQAAILDEILTGMKRPSPHPVTKAAAQAIMDDAPPSWHNDPIEGEYGY